MLANVHNLICLQVLLYRSQIDSGWHLGGITSRRHEHHGSCGSYGLLPRHLPCRCLCHVEVENMEGNQHRHHDAGETRHRFYRWHLNNDRYVQHCVYLVTICLHWSHTWINRAYGELCDKITAKTVDLLVKDGFSSMDAVDFKNTWGI